MGFICCFYFLCWSFVGCSCPFPQTRPMQMWRTAAGSGSRKKGWSEGGGESCNATWRFSILPGNPAADGEEVLLEHDSLLSSHLFWLPFILPSLLSHPAPFAISSLSHVHVAATPDCLRYLAKCCNYALFCLLLFYCLSAALQFEVCSDPKVSKIRGAMWPQGKRQFRQLY